jgi:tetratricopeptide (TPR) repeat protein
MRNEVYRVTVAFFLALGFAPAVAHAQAGRGAFFGGGAPGGGFGGGTWRAGGGIPGGGWHAGGFPGPGFAPGAGGFPGQGFPGQGFPGAATSWSNAHPYNWYNGHWHNHWQGTGFGGYRTFPMLPPLSTVLTSSSAPASSWDRFGTGSGMGGYGGGNYPAGWGGGGWGQGNQWYNSGYVPYYNPYNDPAVTTTFNYGQPIPVPTGAKLADTDNPAVGLAIDRFRAGDYAKALTLVDGVIRIQPYDAAAHELRGLILFAMENYSSAASTIHSVLAIGPGWDWTTLCSVYSDMQLYNSQLAALESYVDLHPGQAGARFLLAYHYITAGRTKDAGEQLQQVIALVPSDKLAASLLRMVRGGAIQHAVPAPAAGSDVTPVDPAFLVGDWHADRDDGATFELKLTGDKKFTWKFTQKDQAQTITGNYTLDKATLTLGGPNNGAMVAQVTTDGDNRFTFKSLDDPSGAPGLTFVKQK